MTDTPRKDGPRTEAGRPDPQSFIPGYRIRYIELETVCAWLRDEGGWGGLLSFDEAVKAMAAAGPRDDGLDVERLEAAIRAVEAEIGPAHHWHRAGEQARDIAREYAALVTGAAPERARNVPDDEGD